MTVTELDPQRFPNLTGIEQPFFEYWQDNILRDDDPHRLRWIEYEEDAVERAHRRNELVERFTPLEGRKVLDVGCQNGAWLVALGQAGAVPVGIDVVEPSVEVARIRTAAYSIDARAEVASACEMPFDDGEFDVVASSDVLEHVPDKSAMLSECVRVLRPGGLLFLVAPQRFSVKHLVRDPHYGHPGISVLPGPAAGWVATKLYREQEYEVETLPTRAWTVRRLGRLGMEVLDDDRAGGAPALVRNAVDELRQAFQISARKR